MPSPWLLLVLLVVVQHANPKKMKVLREWRSQGSFKRIGSYRVTNSIWVHPPPPAIWIAQHFVLSSRDGKRLLFLLWRFPFFLSGSSASFFFFSYLRTRNHNFFTGVYFSEGSFFWEIGGIWMFLFGWQWGNFVIDWFLSFFEYFSFYNFILKNN